MAFYFKNTKKDALMSENYEGALETLIIVAFMKNNFN